MVSLFKNYVSRWYKFINKFIMRRDIFPPSFIFDLPALTSKMKLGGNILPHFYRLVSNFMVPPQPRWNSYLKDVTATSKAIGGGIFEWKRICKNTPRGLRSLEGTGEKTPFSAHIKEMRVRTLFILFSYLLAFFILLLFWREVVYLFTTPISSFGRLFLSTHLSEPFYATLKVCAGVALFINYPFILYHLYSFFIPSLYKREKKGWDPIFYFSIILSWVSIFFTSLSLLPLLLQFFFQFEILSGEKDTFSDVSMTFPVEKNVHMSQNLSKTKVISPGLRILLEPRIDLFVHWSLTLYSLLFFVSQTPLLFLYLSRRGFLPSSLLAKNRKVSILIVLLLSAFLSPPDFFTQFLLFSIFFLFFEISLWTLLLLEERRNSY